MLALFRKHRRSKHWTVLLKTTRRVAMFIVVIGALLFGVLLTNTAVRAAVRDTIFEWFEPFTRYSFSDTYRLTVNANVTRNGTTEAISNYIKKNRQRLFYI